jgi:hypothetical protein
MMSLTLTNVVTKPDLYTVLATYEIQCQDAVGRKTLSENVGFTFNQLTGQVTAELVVIDLDPQESFDEARLHLAHWLEQLAKELKKTQDKAGIIPIFK